MATMVYLLSSCNSNQNPKPEHFGFNTENRQYKRTSSSILLESAKQDVSKVFNFTEKYNTSGHLLPGSDVIVDEKSYLDSALLYLDNSIKKLSDISFRHEIREYFPSQKKTLEDNLIKANNTLLGLPIDSYLSRANDGSTLDFIALTDEDEFNFVSGQIIKKSDGLDIKGNYATYSLKLNGKQVGDKDRKYYFDGTSIIGLYEGLLTIKLD